MQIEVVPAKDWVSKYSELAHSFHFGDREKSFERIDFALVATHEEKLVGYVQCIETDAESIYWQLGGSFPDFSKSVYVLKYFEAGVNKCLEKYKTVSLRVKNDNSGMIRIAMKVGFLVIGTSLRNGNLFLEMVKENFPTKEGK